MHDRRPLQEAQMLAQEQQPHQGARRRLQAHQGAEGLGRHPRQREHLQAYRERRWTITATPSPAAAHRAGTVAVPAWASRWERSRRPPPRCPGWSRAGPGSPPPSGRRRCKAPSTRPRPAPAPRRVQSSGAAPAWIGSSKRQAGHRQRHPREIHRPARMDQRHRQRPGKFQRHRDAQGNRAAAPCRKEIHHPQRDAVNHKRRQFAPRHCARQGRPIDQHDHRRQPHAQRHRALAPTCGKQLLGDGSADLETEDRDQQAPPRRSRRRLLLDFCDMAAPSIFSFVTAVASKPVKVGVPHTLPCHPRRARAAASTEGTGTQVVKTAQGARPGSPFLGRWMRASPGMTRRP